MNWVSGLLYGAGGVVCTCVVLLVVFQERLVYVPVIPGLSKGYPITPARLNLAYEDIWLTSLDGIRLHSWFVKLSNPSLSLKAPTVLFFQENAGNIAHRLEFVQVMMARLKCNVFMLSYRGYGASDGRPTQKGIVLDAQAALDYLLQRKDIDTSRIVVFGRSLGGAVGAALVKNNPGKVSALILENTFTSVLDMAGILLPALKWVIGGTEAKGIKLMNCLVRSPWNTYELVSKIREPLLFLSGLRDEMVPPLHMRQLFDAARHNDKRVFVDFPTGMHMDTWLRGGDRYWRVIQLFLEQYTSGTSSVST
ncbi:hypothetical protein SELMODRAFT_185236 [Selaginella moellendorffii]|uniref:Peptidase S9 prolyl oligopeptidase catalytic domain-containing protein n=2 Tax=Selaginella moellendorffii TaxID=88036 RepID=D8T429_SELML|nr:hypothetical protein SELMODRAFT_185236 [Selaginella moellendorffii]